MKYYNSLIKLLLFCFLLCSKSIFAQDVTIYTVNRDDYNFENITRKTVTQQSAGTKYKTIVFVYDKYRKENIGGEGFYDEKEPTKDELKIIVKNAISDLYSGKKSLRGKKEEETNPIEKTFGKDYFQKEFHSFLGIPWSTTAPIVISRLQELGYGPNYDSPKGIYYSDVYYEGVKFKTVKFEFFTSNKQARYLSAADYLIDFLKISDAKIKREEIANILRIKYGSLQIQTNKEKLTSYIIFENSTGGVKIKRIKLDITKYNNRYLVSLLFYGDVEAAGRVYEENQEIEK
ncbi:MAG: hypothetical protein JWR38_1969 [Mucilaginibacter sp.]|nr:hypothetical protein [Mucilaginibacter sp.]